MTSSESWDTIGMPPILGVGDYHHDRGWASLEQASSKGSLFMTMPQLASKAVNDYTIRHFTSIVAHIFYPIYSPPILCLPFLVQAGGMV